MWYKDKRIIKTLPNKLEIDGKVVFNPKWHHYEGAGYVVMPEALQSVDRKFIKWVDGIPTEMTQAEKDAITSNEQEQAKLSLLSQIYKNYEHAETSNITPAGAITLAQWVQYGIPLAIENQTWFQTLYAERDAKLAVVEAGDLTIDPTPSQPWKPYSFREIQASIDVMQG